MSFFLSSRDDKAADILGNKQKQNGIGFYY
jgi:hypothetical protein